VAVWFSTLKKGKTYITLMIKEDRRKGMEGRMRTKERGGEIK
jgi:hypothetical protein